MPGPRRLSAPAQHVPRAPGVVCGSRRGDSPCQENCGIPAGPNVRIRRGSNSRPGWACCGRIRTSHSRKALQLTAPGRPCMGACCCPASRSRRHGHGHEVGSGPDRRDSRTRSCCLIRRNREHPHCGNVQPRRRRSLPCRYASPQPAALDAVLLREAGRSRLPGGTVIASRKTERPRSRSWLPRFTGSPVHRPPSAPVWNLVSAKRITRSSAMTGMAHAG